MATTRAKKVDDLALLTDLFRSSKAAVFTKVEGLTVKDVTKLRRTLREENVRYVVAKKTLLERAFSAAHVAGVPLESYRGTIGVAFSAEDEVAPAKLLAAVAKDAPNLAFRGAVIAGAYLDAPAVVQLAKLPGRQELLGQLVGTIAAPLSGFVRVLAGPLRGFLTVLTRRSEGASS